MMTDLIAAEVIINSNPVEVLQGGIYNFAGVFLTPELLSITSNNQTIFELADIPAQPSKVFVFLNGIEQTYANDFMIYNSVFTWQSSIRLETNDVLKIYY